VLASDEIRSGKLEHRSTQWQIANGWLSVSQRPSSVETHSISAWGAVGRITARNNCWTVSSSGLCLMLACRLRSFVKPLCCRRSRLSPSLSLSCRATSTKSPPMPPPSTSNTPKKPSEPRPSASVILINEHNEVLMVQRNPQSKSFAGAHVFPGGNYDAHQDPSIAMTAIRETFEETGILLASKTGDPTGISAEIIDEARKDVYAGRQQFTTFLSGHNLKADIDSLLPFSEWITPPQVPRRFHARFFAAFLPLASTLSGAKSGEHYHYLPTPDSESGSSSEVISARFVHPYEILDANSKGEVALMPPQFYLLSTLLELFEVDQSYHSSSVTQQSLARRLSSGPFGRMQINPSMRSSPLSDGRRALIFEGDEERGGKEGQTHRVLMMPAVTGTPPTGMTLLRNFDIFEDDVTRANYSSHSKL